MTPDQNTAQSSSTQNVPDIFTPLFKATETRLLQKYRKHNRELQQNLLEIETITQCFADTASANAFFTYVVIASTRYLPPSFSLDYSPFSKTEWINIEDQLHTLEKQNALPTLHKHSNQDDLILLKAFVLRQLCYQDKLQVTPDDVVLDCGANLGIYSIWSYLQGVKEVYSFEANPFVLPWLKENLGLNHYPYDASHVIHAAVNKLDQTVLFSPKGEILYEPPKELAIDEKEAPKQVPGISLDRWCSEHQVMPTLIRMNLAGSTLSAIDGARQVITQLKPKLVINLTGPISNLWFVPTLIKNLVPEYRFYCRQTDVLDDLYLYAVVEA